MKQILIYRRQFLLTRAPIDELSDWRCLAIGNKYLYTHPDLEVNILENPKRSMAVIGNIYDSGEPGKGNADILTDIAANAERIEKLFPWMKRYSGRYTLIYKDDSEEIIMPDALALREIYYCRKHNRVICGSQPNLIAKFSNPKIEITTNIRLLKFYEDHLKGSKWNPAYKWIGDETYFESVNHLLPNHYLDIKRLEVHRFWPNENIKNLSIDNAVRKSCLILQENLQAMARRHSIMMGVTAGTDSRTLLAASRNLQKEIYYYVNDENLGDSHPDIWVPQKIFETLAIPFHVHKVISDVDEEFRLVFLKNVFFATERILPTIYNIYYKNLSEKVNILGIGEIGRTRFGKEPNKLNGYRMAYKLGYTGDRYAIQKGEEILREMRPAYRRSKVNLLTGFYWEQMLGNWGSCGNSESDIAIEEVNPYNSHQLYEIFLGVDEKFTGYKNNIFFKKMIQHMWPELLEWPINPPFNARDKILKALDEMGLYPLFKEMKYQFNYLRYIAKQTLL